MQYAYLLSLIDADLKRLRMARKLLLTSQTFKQSTGKKAVRLRTSVPGSSSKVIAAPALGTKKQRPLGRVLDKAKVLAPVVQEMSVSTLASEPSIEGENSVVVRASSAIEETISLQPVGEQTPSSGERSALIKRADPLSPRRRLRRVRPSAAKRLLMPSRTVLNTIAPAQPVFVAAEQIRQEQLRKQTGLGIERVGLNFADVPLTAELLRQRWTQSAAG